MPEQRNLVVTGPAASVRLDHYLRERVSGLSRRDLLALFQAGHVRVNGRLASKGMQVQPGDRIELTGIPADTGPAADFDVPLRIIHEDSRIVAVDKPAGIASHPLRAGERGTVVSALLARYPELRGVGYRELESGLLHRLDRDTSGVLLAARDQATFEALRAAHMRGEFEKRYLALVRGLPTPGVFRGYLRADQRKVRVRTGSFAGGKLVSMELLTSEQRGDYALVCVRLSLAARHQVRALLAAHGHPIAGDLQYGGENLRGLGRHFLHASELHFPLDGVRLQLHAALHPELVSVLDALAG